MKEKDKKNIIITILAICVVVGGILNIISELKDRDSSTTFDSPSYLSLPDMDFNKDYNFEYNSSYINVELLENKNELKITPIKAGDTSLKVKYITITNESKTLSYKISVRNGLSLEIENK